MDGRDNNPAMDVSKGLAQSRGYQSAGIHISKRSDGDQKVRE